MIFIDLLSNTVLLNLPFQRRAFFGRSERFGVERGSSRAGQAVIEIDEVPPEPAFGAGGNVQDIWCSMNPRKRATAAKFLD